MTNLPIKTHLTSNNTTELNFQNAIGSLYEVVNEMIGSGAHQNVTILTGSITPTKGIVYVNTESGASLDDLDFANPATLGSKLLIIKPQFVGRAINIRHNQSGTGKFWTQDGLPALLRTPEYSIMFYWNETNSRWEEICRNFGSPVITNVAEKNAFKALIDFSDYMLKSDNLNGLTNPAAARTVLQLGTMALETASNYLTKSGNLSGLTNLATARSNLGLGTAAVLTAGSSANNVLQLNGSGQIPAVDGSLITNIKPKRARYTHQTASGVNGGAKTANAWTPVVLNTEVYNDIGLTLSSNQIQNLPAGDYEVEGYALFGSTNYGTSLARVRIFNVTDNAVIANTISSSSVAVNSTPINIQVLLNKVRFNLSNTKTIRFEYVCDNTTAPFPTGVGMEEVYSDFVITKL